MRLADRCATEFDKRDWRRGKEYFQSDAVLIVDRAAHFLKAEVQGSAASPYDVWLDWSAARRGVLRVDCSCPRFDDMGVCKHVVAAILEADAMGIGARVPGKGDLAFHPMDPESRDDDESDWEDSGGPATRTATRRKATAGRQRKGRRAKSRAAPEWKRRLAALTDEREQDLPFDLRRRRVSSKPRQFWYLLDVERTREYGRLCISLRQRAIKKDGTPGKLKGLKLTRAEIDSVPAAEDRTLLGLLAGNERDLDGSPSFMPYGNYWDIADVAIVPAMFEVLLPRLCASGRFGWLPDDGYGDDGQVRVLAWDDGPPWKVTLRVAKSPDRKHWQLDARLEREATTEELSRPLLLLEEGLVVFPDRIARLEARDDFRWILMLRQGPLLVPVKQEQDLIEQFAQLPCLPRVDWPAEFRWQQEQPAPLPRLTISKPKESWTTDLECELTFDYGERSAPFGDGPHGWYDRAARRLLRRDIAAEIAARDLLLGAGAKADSGYGYGAPHAHFLAPAKLPQLVARLAAAGWHVEAEGKLIRRPGTISIKVTSDVDWFDLEGTCDFGGVTVGLPKLLVALRRGEKYVVLDDGSQGLLPDEWLARYAPLAALGQTEEGRLRFLPTQAALLDALLAAQDGEGVTVDEAFARLRERLRSSNGIRPSSEPRSFVGALRHYQREGLGWLEFLDELGFGGCLADDMGLGKTIQVLALLDGRRQRPPPRTGARHARNGAETAPSLVVVPRSLVFNWIEEAGRFTPELRVLNYTGLARRDALPRFDDYDLIVTTYGTLRRDAGLLHECQFDYAILDEAQAIKNASSQAAKACRLLRARRRLAMTGTPVENHLGELWSLFEFLNPGMLGRNQKLQELISPGRRGRHARADGESDRRRTENLAILARALRPFLLRRTKKQVLTELPPKTEQTLYCELDGAQRELYDELREHYRRSLLARVSKVGVNKSKIQVLEALLRLRQAACHPGLLDKKKVDAASAKLETLLEQLSEVMDEGHKALVFSQFTSLLAIVRGQLDRRKVVYEYLDGRTVKRQAKVERFQTDPACPLFLISLKAGGQGLNLTAADYVFILDPWWNPAVEAQAVDRAHRMGQDRHVFAYRLIARDTVEEKILQLQEHKRGLAEAIVSAENSVLRDLTAEDLQLLLS